jgi:recombination protein RecA
LDIRRIEAVKAGGDVIGSRTRVTVKKNKVAPPFKVAEFDIMYNQGISKVGDILDIAVTEEIIEKRGAFFSYGDTRLAQGRENAKTFLTANPDLTFEIENKIRTKFGLPQRDRSSVNYGPVMPAGGVAEETIEQADE